MAALFEACRRGDLVQVKKLVNKGHSVNGSQVHGRTPLIVASIYGHSDIVRYLLEQNANVNITDDPGLSALCYACEGGHLDVVNMLLSKGAETEAKNARDTPLMRAIRYGHPTVVEALISSGASVNVKTFSGDTVLDYALEREYLNIINMLISKGAVIMSEDGQDMTPLIGAIVRGHQTEVEALISSGANVNSRNNRGYTALQCACQYGHLHIVKTLISNGANIEAAYKAEDCYGMTPLLMAAQHGYHLVVEVLISSGANVNNKNQRGYTALHWACQYGHLHIVKTLISNGANIEAEAYFRRTPLINAAEHGYHLVVEVLISSGASIDNRLNLTALWYAADNNHNQCCLLLIAAGADVRLISKDLQGRLICNFAKEGLDSGVKTAILTGIPVNFKDGYGFTALHYAAEHNHIQCGILLIEGGADIRIKDSSGKLPLDNSSAEFKAAVEDALSFRSKKTICVIGNACSGKSTLIASLQNEKASFLKKVSNRIFGVKDIRQRTAGIEPVSLSSKRYGNVVMFDFAGQHEYHGPHEMLLESMLTKSGSTMTAIFVVKVTEEATVISQQLYRWLTPISKMSSSSNPVRVIVVGSFLDKVKSKAQAQEKLIHCFQRIQEDLKDAAMEFQGTCFLNCRQPYSSGIDQLCQWLSEIPTPQYKATDTPYSISWVVSRINHTFDQKAIKLVDLSQWMDDNKADLPTNLPSAEVVCSDLSATGHFLFLPNKEDSSKSWLILDLPTILHDVYGRLFSPFEKIVDQFGLLKCLDLQQLFSTLDEDMIRNVLIALEFCIEVDPTLLSEEIMKLKGSKDDFLFFPALVSAQPPEAFPGPPTDLVLPTLCWQLQADDKHFISPRLLQTIILRLAAHHVFHHQLGQNSREHCCSVWWNGISWQSRKGVDVAVQISDNALVQVISRSKAGPDVLCRYIADITFDIITTIRQLLKDFSATSYIICTSNPTNLLKEPQNLSSHATFPSHGVLASVTDEEEFCLSRPDQRGQSASLSVSELFSGMRPSLHTVQMLCFDHLDHDGECFLFVCVNIPLFLNKLLAFHYILWIIYFNCMKYHDHHIPSGFTVFCNGTVSHICRSR